MIRLVQGEGEKRRLLALCEKTPFGCKIASIANSYGFDKSFANFWLNTEEDVVYCLVDGAMLLSGTVLQGDASREFLHVVGAREVLCAVRNAEAMNLTPTQVGDVLKHTQEPGDLPKELPPSVNIREIYTLLEKAGMIGEFEPFYLDLSHKLRHNEALALTERGPEGLRACAVVSSISQRGAILSALAVREGMRRQGLGSRLVRRAESYFPGKMLYVFRSSTRTRNFTRAWALPKRIPGSTAYYKENHPWNFTLHFTYPPSCWRPPSAPRSWPGPSLRRLNPSSATTSRRCWRPFPRQASARATLWAAPATATATGAGTCWTKSTPTPLARRTPWCATTLL